MLSKGECKHLQLGLLVILFSVIITDAATFGHDGVHSTISSRKYTYSLAFGSYQRPSITTTNKSSSRNSKSSRFHYKDQSMEDENKHQCVDSTHKSTNDAIMNAFLLRKINGKNEPLSQPRNRHSNRSKTKVRNEQSRNRKYNKTNPQRGSRQQHGKPYQQAKYRSHFTEFRIAPALQLVDPPSAPSSSQTFDRNQVYSPVVLEHTREECVDYICGPLAVTYTNDDDSVRLWIEENVYATGTDTQNGERYSFVGFDVEAVPNVHWRKANPFFANRPATVQLSTPTSAILIHLTQEKPIVSLQKLLADPKILKVGVAINDDMLELYRWNPIYDSKGRFDLSGIGATSQMVSLQKLVRAIVGVELPKSKKTAMSNWSRIPLSDRQIVYASRDAWAGAAVMENLNLLFPSMNVEVLGDLVHKHERNMEDIDLRRRLKKGAKIKVKDVMRQFKQYVMHSSKHKPIYLPSILPVLIKEEIQRLHRVMDENSPDSIHYFEAESLGLDFSFDDPERE